MTEKRFIYDGLHIRDTFNEIPSILTHDNEQRDKFLNGLNKLHEEKELWKKECERLKGLYYLKNGKDEHLI